MPRVTALDTALTRAVYPAIHVWLLSPTVPLGAVMAAQHRIARAERRRLEAARARLH